MRLAGASIALALVTIGCATGQTVASGGERIVANGPGGTVSVDVPARWHEDLDQPDDVVVGLVRATGDAFFHVQAHAVEDVIADSLAGYADLGMEHARDGLDQFVLARGPLEHQLAGHAAITYVYHSTMDRSAVTIRQTSMRVGEHYYQINFWALTTKYASLASELSTLRDSLAIEAQPATRLPQRGQ